MTPTNEETRILRFLQRAEENLREAYEHLTEETEYLREALDQQVSGLNELIIKMDRERALLRDRDALQSIHAEGIGEWIRDNSSR